MLKLYAVLAAVIAVAVAQRCNIPPQWEARLVAFDPNERRYHNHTSNYNIYAHYVYDQVNARKFRVEEASFGDSGFRRLAILELYQTRRAYVTDLQTRDCTIYNINEPFFSHEIPANAEFYGYEYLGSSPYAIELSTWGADVTYAGQTGRWYGTYTTDNCVPVRSDIFFNTTGFHFEEFTNVVLGIGDPNVFIPPAGCRPAQQ
jgi:hypothetical protein